ncbi:MAG TPA: RDD family protein [Bacillota bacterium]
MEDYKIITPENVELDYKIADVGSRFLALCIDTLIQWLTMLGVIFLLTLLNVKELNLDTRMAGFSESVVIGIVIALPFVFQFLYFVILETAWSGQTIGKRVLNIRVRKEGGYPPGFWDIFLRNLIRAVDLLPIFYGIGFITMFFNKKAKRLGDYAAGTIVVKEVSRRRLRRFLKEELSPVDSSPVQPSGDTVFADTGCSIILPYITREDYYLLKDLISRREKLSNYGALAEQVLRSLLAKASADQSPDALWADPGKAIESLVAFYERQTR